MIQITHMTPFIQHMIATGMIAFPIVLKIAFPKIWNHISNYR